MFYLAHLEMSHYRISMKALDWNAFVFYCTSKIIHPCSGIILPFNADDLLRRWSFLECVNYFSFELVGVLRIFQFVWYF